MGSFLIIFWCYPCIIFVIWNGKGLRHDQRRLATRRNRESLHQYLRHPYRYAAVHRLCPLDRRNRGVVAAKSRSAPAGDGGSAETQTGPRTARRARGATGQSAQVLGLGQDCGRRFGPAGSPVLRSRIAFDLRGCDIWTTPWLCGARPVGCRSGQS